MTLDEGSAGAQGRRQAPLGRLASQTPIGSRYIIEALAWKTVVAEIYDATDIESGKAVSVHLMAPALVAAPAQRQAFMQTAGQVRSIGHPGLAAIIDVGVDGQHCFTVTERLQGKSLRALLMRRQQSGSPGVGARAAAAIMGAVCDALDVVHAAGAAHGALSADVLFISDAATVKIVHAGLGPLLAMAVRAGALPQPADMAPEVPSTGPSAASDIFSAGHLLYQMLLGQPLAKGGPRPSQAVPGITASVDQVIARAAAAQPGDRPDSIGAIKEALSGAPTSAPGQSLVSSPGIPLSPGLHAAGPAASAAPPVGIDPALLADTSERWLVCKGKLDYGPFSLAELVENIRTNQVLPGNIIIDNFSGERCIIEEHPLLGPLVEHARQARDDSRRANAEVAHASQEKRRGVMLFAFIACGVLALGGVAYVIVTKTGKEAESTTGPKISTVGGGEFQAQIRFPEKKKTSTSKRSSGRKSSTGGSDTLALDMSDQGGGSEVLDESTINGIIQKNGNRLGSCLASNGGGLARINFIIDGPSGRVSFVQVNGQQSGGLYSCINRAMRTMKFPAVNGPRTRADFEMEL